ncbi:MAG: hypothetical protein IPM50_14580 [Acidobacteriota bacterium]|nr:MAG: hypothetical protein IPM50_14580 [Acidobacteriota bacterium]
MTHFDAHAQKAIQFHAKARVYGLFVVLAVIWGGRKALRDSEKALREGEKALREGEKASRDSE